MNTPSILAAGALALSLFIATPAAAAGPGNTAVRYKTVNLPEADIFYREAGPADAPVIVLLHGFPSSSRMFGALFPLLSSRFRLIAPDFPGFGHSDAPPPSNFSYTFDHLADCIRQLLDQL